MRLLRTGGMSEVYEAERAGETYAVKVLREEYVASEQIRDRMRIDAEVPLRIEEQRGAPHPNVVRVLELGETRTGRPYVAMERLYGHTLHEEAVERGALPPIEAVDYALQALRGVSAAHRLGVVHRDLKPANLFLSQGRRGERVVKVLDFGYARVFEQRAAGHSIKPLVISTDDFVGTHRWAAPEQARPETAKRVDQRADLYTLGLVLYSLLCGRIPFRDLNRRAELLRAQIAKTMDPISPDTARRISTELVEVLSTALAKDRERRFANAGAFITALERLAERYDAQHATDSNSDFPLTAKQHAQMTAELELYPERADAIRHRYGLRSASAWQAAKAAWSRKIAADPAVQRKWQAEVRRYRRHLLASSHSDDE